MRIVQLATGEPWLIKPEAVAPLLEIASRVDRLDRASMEPMVERVEAVAARSGSPIAGAKNARIQGDGVAVLPIHGPIMRHAGMFDDVCGVASIEGIDRDLKAALASPDVRSIVLHVDSPGGMAADVGEMAEKIRMADGVKPVRAYVGNQSASAAMWLAAGAREVVASPTAILGSIGVVLTARDTSARDERDGVKNIEIISSVSPGKRPDPATDSGRAALQAVVDRLGDEFVDGMARLRGVSREHVLEKFGKGGQLVGRDAVSAGLADRIGSFDALVREAGAGHDVKGADRNMAKDNETQVGAEATEAIRAQIRAEIEAEVRAQAAADVKAAHRTAIDARVESALLRLSGKLAPAQAEGVKGLFTALASDDLEDGGGRFKALEGVLAGLPDAGLVDEIIPSDRGHSASDGDPKGDDLSEVDAETERFVKRGRA